MDLVIPYNLAKEEKRATIDDDLVASLVEPNSLPAYDPQQFYPERIGSYRDPIFKILRGRSSFSILVDDHTRPTPARFVIPELLNIAEVSGVRDIRIVIAFGTHEHPPEEYLVEKVGRDVYSEFPIILHDAYSRKEHEMLGYTKFGTPLLINRWVASSDVKISVGSIFPSSLAGFTGGAKMVLPGVAYYESIDRNHSMFNESFLGKVDGNPMRQDMEEAARIAGLDLTIDSVLAPDGKVVSLHTGEPIGAHREGVKVSARVYEKRVPSAGIVVIGCGSTDDIDFIHLAKALEVADLVCEEGGIIVMVGACTLGMRWQELTIALRRDAGGETDSEVEVFSHLFIHRYSSIFLERTKAVFWVTDPRHQDLALEMGFEFYGNLQAAVDEAIRRKRNGITVLPRGSLLLPIPS